MLRNAGAGSKKELDVSKMILINLNGGLGNQLFQYALGRRLSYERNLPLRFDLSLLEASWSIRQFKLGYFQTQGKPINEGERKKFYRYQDLKVFTLLQNSLPYYRRRIVNEKSPMFDENILRTPSKIFLQGYWQSYKYFTSIRDVLQKELRLNVTLDALNKDKLESIRNTSSVSIHIRRGDYVHNPETNKAHGVLPLEYYDRAIKMMKEKVTAPHFYVFSDDIPWVRENMRGLENAAFVDHNDSDQDYFDLALMKECQFHITANSSFSWWAAWLSGHENKIVIAPKKWYQTERDTSDLCPEEWIRI